LSKRIKKSIRFDPGDLQWLENEVARIGPGRTSLSDQVRVCVVQRRISLLPPEQRELVYSKLGVQLGGEVPSLAESDSPEFEFPAEVDDDGADVHVQEEEDLIQKAWRIVAEAGRASTSHLQRELRLGYSRAAGIMDVLEDRGLIGPPNGTEPREVFDEQAAT